MADVIEWQMVDRLAPVDLSNISDKGMKGAVMLAVSLGWNLAQRPGQPAQLVSRQGVRRNVPTDTGVRQSVFWGLIANILSQSEGRVPTRELIDLIVNQTGMSRAHAHVLKSRTALLTSRAMNPDGEDEPDEEEFAEDGEDTGDESDEGHEPVSPSAIALGGEMRVEPTLAIGAEGSKYESMVMDTIIRRLTIDGEDQITYRCRVCGLEYETKRGVGSHYGQHVRRGEAESTEKLPKKYVSGRIPEYEPVMKYRNYGKGKAPPPKPKPKPPPVVHTEPTTELHAADVNDLAVLLQGVVDIAVGKATTDLREQLDAANAEIERLKQERIALRDLLQ